MLLIETFILLIEVFHTGGLFRISTVKLYGVRYYPSVRLNEIRYDPTFDWSVALILNVVEVLFHVIKKGRD
jgi:hypothetical protein